MHRWSALNMIFHFHTSLRTISGPNAVLYAYPISPIADKNMAKVNSNNQIAETIRAVEDNFTSSFPLCPVLRFSRLAVVVTHR